jgi:trehalose synthase-fused probable maltokinase
VQGSPAAAFRRLRGEGELPAPTFLGAEQSNTSWVFGQRLVGKLLRRVEEGVSPELELCRHLSERVGFPHVPPLAASVEVRRPGGEASTLAIFQAFVPNEGDAWTLTLGQIARYLEDVLAGGPGEPAPASAPPALLERASLEPPPPAVERSGFALDQARLLGTRTADLHVALAASDDPAFAPETLTPFARRSLYQSLRNLAVRACGSLREQRGSLPPAAAELADRVLAREDAILEDFRSALEQPLGGRVIRVHGDYHLGQVLYTGRDFAVIDFEGEPARSLGERRRKRSPLVDVASMLRSFHYAVEFVLAGRAPGTSLRPGDLLVLAPWARHWHAWVTAAFLAAYLERIRGEGLVPERGEDLARLLELHMLEKALYEVAYELDNRPDWVEVPLRGVLELLETGGS